MSPEPSAPRMRMVRPLYLISMGRDARRLKATIFSSCQNLRDMRGVDIGDEGAGDGIRATAAAATLDKECGSVATREVEEATTSEHEDKKTRGSNGAPPSSHEGTSVANDPKESRSSTHSEKRRRSAATAAALNEECGFFATGEAEEATISEHEDDKTRGSNAAPPSSPEGTSVVNDPK